MEMNDPFAEARREMVEGQLRRRGITSPVVLGAMGRVPRERFLTADLAELAYTDRALPIEADQTISQPYIVALMTELLDLHGGEKVLEIGTGSGYQAAVLAEIAAEVVSVERHGELSAAAGWVLDELGYSNVTLVVGDGSLGYPPGAPYDRITVTAASDHVPPALFEQLCEGGVLVIPVGSRYEQCLHVVRKTGGRPSATIHSPCRFVPLVGADAWPE